MGLDRVPANYSSVGENGSLEFDDRTQVQSTQLTIGKRICWLPIIASAENIGATAAAQAYYIGINKMEGQSIGNHLSGDERNGIICFVAGVERAPIRDPAV